MNNSMLGYPRICFLRRSGIAVLAIALAGSGSDASAIDDGACSVEIEAVDVAADMPPIHVDQIVEMLLSGINGHRSDYLERLHACQAAGRPTRALSEADVALLGTTRYEMWFSSDLDVFRERSWELDADGPGPSCLFRLQMSGSQQMQTAKKLVDINLVSGKRSEYPAKGDELARYSSEGYQHRLGFRGPTPSSVAGQPCNEWIDSGRNDRQCVWSAGVPWGFTSGGVYNYRPSRWTIVLEQEPIDGIGDRVTTQTMTVGKPFDTTALQAPPPTK